MPLSPSAYFRNAPGRSRLARTSSFRIFATDFRPRIQPHSLHLRPDAIPFYPSGGPDPQPPGEAAHCDPIPGLKENA